MCGDYAVGKTTFVQIFLGGGAENGYKATIGVDIGRKAINIDIHKIIFQIWDLSGQQSFKMIRSQFYSRTDGAILVYDVSRRETYQNIIKWKNELVQQTKIIPTVLIANKIDLREAVDDCVNTREGETLANTISEETGLVIPYFEASAILKINTYEPFRELGKTILTGFKT
jgi:small GTP-binding protein